MASTARNNDPPSSEFSLAIECCRWCFAGGDGLAVRRLMPLIDWRRFVRVSKRQRVEGLVWHCLRGLAVALPAAVERSLAADAEGVAQHNLRAARQSALLLKAFDGAGIPLIFVKGLTLSKLAYGDPFLKMSRDIDVLVPEERIAAAGGELERLGYVRTLPPQSSPLVAWHRTRKESVWRSPDDLQVELHSRLADNRELIPGIGVGSPRQQVEIAPRIKLPTLGPDELFAFLCVHGASSAWFRLKWITDLAALLHGCGERRIGQLYDHSQWLGAGRAAAQALLLAARTYGTAIGGLEPRLNSNAINRRLGDAAWNQMQCPGEPTETRFGTATIHWTQLLLVPGIRFSFRELARQVRDAVA